MYLQGGDIIMSHEEVSAELKKRFPGKDMYPTTQEGLFKALEEIFNEEAERRNKEFAKIGGSNE